MNPSQVNRRIKIYLQDLADEGTFHMRKKMTGHPVCVASYGGVQRSFSLCNTPGKFYPKLATAEVNRFVRGLPLEDPPRFTLHKDYEDH